FGRDRRLEQESVLLDRAQTVGDVLQGGNDDAAVGGRGLVEPGLGGAFLVQQGSGVEQGLRRAAGHGPEQIFRRDQTGELGSDVSGIAAEGDVRQRVGDGDADQSGRRVQQLLRRAYVGALLDQLGRYGDGQIARQAQLGKRECLQRLLTRVASGQRGEQV